MDKHNEHGPQVWKLQRPVHPPGGEWLVYDHGRHTMWQQRPTNEMRKLMGSEFKIYVLGTVEYTPKGNLLTIQEVVEEPHW